MTKLEKVRAKLHKALETYPSNSEEILRLSRLLDILINRYYRRNKSMGEN